MPTRERVQAFIDRVVSGAHIEAIEEFYTEDSSMQENLNPPRQGRDVLTEGERRALARVKEMRTRPVTRFAIEGDIVFINWIFDAVQKDGAVKTLDEIAVQEWRGDRIWRERFYYDPKAFT
jgi:hypothetical protein